MCIYKHMCIYIYRETDFWRLLWIINAVRCNRRRSEEHLPHTILVQGVAAFRRRSIVESATGAVLWRCRRFFVLIARVKLAGFTGREPASPAKENR
jgi:hypothetical protein